MKRPAWLRDTLGKRLFLLMCVALVASHLAAYLLVTTQVLPSNAQHGPMALPTLPSLPPTPGLQDVEPGAGRMPPPPRDVDSGPGGAPPRTPWERGAPGGDTGGVPGVHGPVAGPPPAAGGLPPLALVADYGVRLLLIALAAWWGARWLARPMRRLVDASGTLGATLGGRAGAAVPRLDEREGTHEVREAARVFNRMAGQLDEQFRSR